MLVETLLGNAGYTIEMAEDGREAVKVASSGMFDLILMDIQMPEIDGIEATRMIRALGGGCASVPIVALTAHAMAGDRARFLEAGMNDPVTKPIRTVALLATVARWIATPVVNAAGRSGPSHAVRSGTDSWKPPVRPATRRRRLPW